VTKKWIAVAAAAALFTASTIPLSAQTTSSNSGQPILMAQESGGASTSGGATSGGATSGGATTPAPAPEPAAPPPEAAPAPGPAAGPVAAAAIPFNPFIVGGVVAAGVIVCAIVCFGKSTTSTSATTVH